MPGFIFAASFFLIIIEGERPFRCTECDYSTAFQSALMTHIRTHSGERPYKCADCAYAAPTKSDLTKHTRKHTGDYRHLSEWP